MKLIKILLSSLLFLPLLTSSWEIPEEPIQPTGRLGVKLDYAFTVKPPFNNGKSKATGNKDFFYSSHLTFKDNLNDPVRISDNQMVQMAFDAFQEMRHQRVAYGIPNKAEPVVIVVLVVENEIFIASSLKGASPTYNFHGSQIKDTLEICQAIFLEEHQDREKDGTGDTASGHRNGGGCAEVLAAHQYYRLHDPDEKHLIPTLAEKIGNRLVAVRQKKDQPVTVFDPCGNPNDPGPEGVFLWGCWDFRKSCGIRAIREKDNVQPAPYDLQQLGLQKTDYVPICDM